MYNPEAKVKMESKGQVAWKFIFHVIIQITPVRTTIWF